MKLRTNQSGFSIVEVIVVIVALAVIGLLGYTFYNSQVGKPASSDQASSSQSASANDVKTAPEITDTAGLDQAAATLDQTDPSGGSNDDTSQLDAELANF